MRCPSCSFEKTVVLDSREINFGLTIRRRRECPVCKCRFTTYENCVDESSMNEVKSIVKIKIKKRRF